METKENQQQPPSFWDWAERWNNVAGLTQIVIAALGPLLMSAGLQMQAPTPAIEIHIHQQPESEILIKLEQAKETINQLRESEDKETLSEAMEAISELQQLISEKRTELQQIQAQHPGETAEIEAQLQTVISELEAIKKTIEANRDALSWLDPDTQQEYMQSVIQKAGNDALAGQTYDPKQIQQFYEDITDFLFLIHRCLIVCRPNLLDRALAEDGLPPRTTIPKTVYAEALKKIEERAKDEIYSEAAKKALEFYLDHLITALS